MWRTTGLVALMAVLLGPGAAFARIPRGGQVVGPGGVMYDTRSSEWRASGGNIYVYQQIMMQKAARRQQQMMFKQQQALMKQQQQLKKKSLTPSIPQTTAPTIAPKKKKRTYDPTRPVGSQPSISTAKTPKPEASDAETAPKAEAKR